MAPVIRELKNHPADFTIRICTTGQHRQMLDQVLNLFDLIPDLDLNLMQPGQTPSQVTARVLTHLEPVLAQEKPDWVLVQGDTTTVMAAAITAHHLRIRVGHIEAGLRTRDRWNPFPEEMNRVLADHLSDVHFAPTECARQNLLREGIAEHTIHVTGNTIVDALLWVAQKPIRPDIANLLQKIKTNNNTFPCKSSHPQPDNVKLVLVTAHRRENFGDPLKNICLALRNIAKKRNGEVQVVYPVHLNPHVQQTAYRLLAHIPNITLLPPVDYLTLVNLMKHSALILTDSGGIQEEAPTFGVPVLVMRAATERPEAVQAGVAKVVGTDTDHIVQETLHLLSNPVSYANMAHPVSPFGDGRAAERIVNILRHWEGCGR